MARILKQIQIDAPREHVFALAADINRHPDWTTFVKEAAVTSGDGKSAATTDRTTIKVGPRATTAESSWTEYQAGEVFGRRSTTGMAKHERLTFTAANGGTLVEWMVEYTPPMGALGAFMDAFMMNRVFQNEIEASLKKLKHELES